MKLLLSPSLKFGNLEQYNHGKINYQFVHDCNRIVWIDVDSRQMKSIDFNTESTEDIENHIVYLKCLSIPSSSNPILVAASNRLLRIYSLSPEPKHLQSIRLSLKICVVGLDQLTPLSCVLVSSNFIQIFTYKSREFQQTSKTVNSENVICSASDGASGLILVESSALSLWKGTDKKLVNLKRFPLPLNCKAVQVQLDVNWIIIGTISGQIQILIRESGKLLCEIQAHSAALTSIYRWENYIFSAAEDHFIRIFMITNEKPESFQVKFCRQFNSENQIPVGVSAYRSHDNQQFCCATYFENFKIQEFYF